MPISVLLHRPGCVKNSWWIPRPPWLMSPTWLVNLCNDQVAISDKAALTFSRIRRAWLQGKQRGLPERNPHRWKLGPSGRGITYALFIQCVWGLHEIWKPQPGSAFLSRTSSVKVHNGRAEFPKLIKNEDNGSDRISFPLWACVSVETELMENAGEHKRAVTPEFVVEK